MTSRQYDRPDQARAFSQYRPSPPPELIEIILNYMREQLPPPYGQAVDIGCGTGQSTIILAPFFLSVVGCDVSKPQIQEANLNRKTANILYKVAAAESVPLSNESVQLMTAATCLHWFDDKDAFFAEAKRILVPGGVLAIYSSCAIYPTAGNKEKDFQLHQLTDKFLFEDMNTYRSPRVQEVFEQYKSIDFPFDNVLRIPNIRQTYVSTAADISGYVRSMATFQNFRDAHPKLADRLLEDYNKRVLQILEITSPSDLTPVSYQQDYFLILCRKSKGLVA